MTNNITPSSAAVFMSEQAPYIKYLSATERKEARTLERDLRTAAAVIKHRNTASSERNAHTRTIAVFWDVEHHTGGKGNNLRPPETLVDGGREVPEAGPIANYMNKLGDCGPSVHTRVIVLYGERASAEAEAANGLLFCHILGIILDLPPVDVRFLAQLNASTNRDLKKPPRPYQLSMKPGFVSLGESTICYNRGSAAYLGRRKLGKNAPYVGEYIPKLRTSLN